MAGIEAYVKDVLLNIFIIFSPLWLYPYIQKSKPESGQYKLLLLVAFSFAMAITMSFPVVIEGVNYDFRSILLTVGSLYGGGFVTVALYGVLLASRWMTGAPNMWEYACAFLPTMLLTGVALRKYATYGIPGKIMTAVILCTVVKLVTITTYLLYIGRLEQLVSDPLLTLVTYVLAALITGVFVYAVEFLHRYVQMQDEVHKIEKSKIVSEMAASVAHEIRNPLTTVRGFIQLFGEDNLDKQRKDYYRTICLEELDRAQLIITDYLALAKPDPECIEVIELTEEIQYLSNVLLTYANFNNIHVNGTLSGEDPPSIVGDRYKFRQALVNIGKNAIEAMNGGGTLTIKSYKLKDEVILIVSDTGIGMTPAQIKRLGTPYYSTKEKGTGLGTMVSFGILKKMNGKIDVKSEVGKGTVYTITFPKR